MHKTSTPIAGQEFAGSGNNMKSLKIMAIFLELFSMSK